MDTIDLTFEEKQRRSDLVRKLKQGEISFAKAHEIRKQMVSQKGNYLPFFVVTFLISYVHEYIESKSNSLTLEDQTTATKTIPDDEFHNYL
jgi:hypothetical protein